MSELREILDRAPFELDHGVLVPKIPTAAVDRGALAQARRHYHEATQRIAALDYEAAARHCELAYTLEPWRGYRICAAVSYGAAGKMATSTALLREYAGVGLRVPRDEATEAMERHFESGQDFYEQRKFAEARAEFAIAYSIKPAASLLYNAAVCSEKMREYHAAAQDFRRYLSQSPTTKDRRAVEGRIATLEAATPR